MADVVRSGAIFRVRDAAALQSPDPRSSSSSSSRTAPARVRRVVVSALEAASSAVDTSRVQASSTRRHNGDGTHGATLLPETPAGMPKRKARLQQTPNLRKKLSIRSTVSERTPEEIEASFNQLVMNVTLRKKKSSSARRASSSNSTSSITITPRRRTRSQSVSSSASSSSASLVEIASATASRVTRSATKAHRQELVPVASPASSVQTQILESTEEEDELEDDDDAPEDKTSPATRKTTQAKRSRAAGESLLTSVRSSKRLRAQQRLLSSLPPARSPIAQMGNTKEDEELLQIQKRLVFGKSRKSKASIQQQPKKQQTGSASADDSTAEEEDGDGDDSGGGELAERVLAPQSSPRRRSDQKQRLSASFSILEDVEALPKAKKMSSSVQKETKTSSSKTSKRTAKSSSTAKIMLCNWTPQWPPAYEQAGGSSSGQKQKNMIQLVFEGQIEGRDAMVQFAKRVSAFEFVSTTNERVELDGALDVEMARAHGVPKVVVEILGEGLPINWRQKLGAVVNRNATLKRKKAARFVGELETEPEEEDEIETPRTKRSRSGRMITPVMDWWRGERLKTDVNGVTIVDHGSPAFLSSPPKKAKRATALSSKPPRTPVAPKTPVKAKTPTAKAKQVNKDLKESDAPDWTEEQLQALVTAKMQIPTTATNFWAEVATFVGGKTANECRTKSFEEFASPTSRAAHKKKSSEAAAASSAAVGPGSAIKIPTKVHRAGSNLFKKQVRQFVQQYEKKHVDDLFDNTTPSKSELVGAMGLDDIKSPAAPLDNNVSLDDDDDDDDFVGGRELLQEISSNKRDEVDSYVLSLKRSRVLGEPSTVTKSSARTSFLTPSTLKKKSKSMKRAVHMYEAVGSHHIEGVVSPGGTTHVRINKDSDATSDEEGERDSEDENSDDDVF